MKLLLLLLFPTYLFAQNRPNTFIEFNNMPRWYKNSAGELAVEKSGFTYPSNEFKTVRLQGDHLYVYSISEQESFYCENFYSTDANIRIKIIPINCYGDKKNTFVVTTNSANGGRGYFIIDKGQNINSTGGGWINGNDGNTYYQVNGSNGKKYFLIAGYDATVGKTIIAYPTGEPHCVGAIRQYNVLSDCFKTTINQVDLFSFEVNYIIVSAETIESLVEKVNYYISMNWITQGGVSYTSKHRLYMQSMIPLHVYNKEETDTEPDNIHEAQSYDSIKIEVVALDDNSTPKKELQPEFLSIVDNEFSDKAALLIYRKHITSINELLVEMKSKWFQAEAGVEIIEELKAFVVKYSWKEKNGDV